MIATKVVRVDSTGYWKQADWSETWTDIWLSWKDRRRPRSVCLTVMARADVENEIATYEHGLTSDSFDEDTRQLFSDELSLNKQLLVKLGVNEVCFADEDATNIWVADEFLGRRSIEKAIRLYFSTFAHSRPIRIKWKSRLVLSMVGS